MAKSVSYSNMKKNVIISVAAQVVSIIVSFLISLIVPKFISELEYSYWQMYMLYVGYVGVLHFGMLDGIVLRYSEYDYEELDKPRIRSQFKLMLYIISTIAFTACAISVIGMQGAYRHILFFVAMGIITKNIYTYSSYTFQITNRISKYAILVISMKLFYGLMVIFFLLIGVKNFYWYCVADLLSDLFGCVVASFYNKGLYFGKSLPLKEALAEFKINVGSGIMLMIANWSAGLVIGSAKMIVQWHWDELTFGKFSFSFSLSNLFLTFVTAISVVLFPSLKRMKKEELPRVYSGIRNALSPLLFIVMIFYYPGCVILNAWLPKYSTSLVYLGVMLPIIVYTSKVSLLTNNYLKAYRKERVMLLINVLSVIAAVLLFVISAYVFNNIMMLVVLVVMVIMGRSIASEIAVSRIIQKNFIKEFIIEAVVTVGFIVATSCFSLVVGMTVYGVILAIYLYLCKDTIIPYLKKLKREK